jgi:hypothetical protein
MNSATIRRRRIAVAPTRRERVSRVRRPARRSTIQSAVAMVRPTPTLAPQTLRVSPSSVSASARRQPAAARRAALRTYRSARQERTARSMSTPSVVEPERPAAALPCRKSVRSCIHRSVAVMGRRTEARVWRLPPAYRSRQRMHARERQTRDASRRRVIRSFH